MIMYIHDYEKDIAINNDKPAGRKEVVVRTANDKQSLPLCVIRLY